MRVIAGSLRSRTLQAPQGFATRPTSDRLRETLFNVLAPRIKDATFLDLYAGSGAVGIEALSRGAARVVFLERAPAALKILRANVTHLGITAGFDVAAESAKTYLKRSKEGPFNIVFLDPPYEAADEYTSTLSLLGASCLSLLAPHALIIAEHRRKQSLDACYGSLARTRLLEQGDAALSFYAAEPPSPDKLR